MKARSFTILCAASALTLAGCLYAVQPGVLPHEGASAVDDVLQLSCSLFAVFGYAWTARRSTGNDRRWRRWMVCSSSSLTVGLVAWMYSQVVVGVSLPATTLAPLGFIMTAVFLLPAVLTMARGETSDDEPPSVQRNKALLLLDGLILTCSLVILVSITLSEQITRSWAQSGPGFTTVVAHPAIYLVIMLIMVVLARTRPAARQTAMWVLFAAAFTQSASAWVFAYLVANGAESIPPAADAGFMAAPMLFALAPWAPPPARRRGHVRDDRLRTGAYLHLLVPFLPLVVTGVFIGVGTATGISLGPLQIYLGLTVVALVVLRQLLTSADNVRLLHSLEDSRGELKYQATHDPVTGLANRGAFQERLSSASQPLVLLFIDVDDFKSVNDQFGHATGDAVLRAVGERLIGCVRDTDLVARLGGDEFGVLIEVPCAEHDEIGRRVLASLSQPYSIAGVEHTVRVSIGLVARSEIEPGVSGDVLLSQADVAMYAAKRAGKGTLVVG